MFGFQTRRFDQYPTSKTQILAQNQTMSDIRNPQALSKIERYNLLHPALISFYSLAMWMAWRLLSRPSTAATGSCNWVLQTGQVIQFFGSRPIPCEMKRYLLNKTWNALVVSILTFKQPWKKVCEQGRNLFVLIQIVTLQSNAVSVQIRTLLFKWRGHFALIKSAVLNAKPTLQRTKYKIKLANLFSYFPKDIT